MRPTQARATPELSLRTRCAPPYGSQILDGLRRGASGAVVLHVSGHGLPTLSVPSVHMTAVRSGPIAVPDLAHLRRTCLKCGEATLHETRLAFHEPTLPSLRIDVVVTREVEFSERSDSGYERDTSL
jgi:hypothetical protein